MFVLKIDDIACTKVSQCIVNTIFSKNFLTTVLRITTTKNNSATTYQSLPDKK
jgi:hypothetical protein